MILDLTPTRSIKRIMENKICKNCWYYTSAPITKEDLDDSVSPEDFHYCELYGVFPVVTADDTCKNWKSKRLELISITKPLFGF
jgi:hypothetical protein